MGERHLICERVDGIGGRFLTLLWTWRLARRINARVLMFWPPMDPRYGKCEGAAELLDIFQLASAPLRNELQIVDGRCDEHFSARHIDLYHTETYDPMAFASTLPPDNQHYGRLPVIEGWRGPFLEPGERRADALAEIPELFGRLPVRRDIENAVARASKGRKLYKKVAVHVRRGEIVANLRAAYADYIGNPGEHAALLDERVGTFLGRCLPLETYVRLLRPLLERGHDLLLFTDAPEIADELKERLGREDLPLASDLAPVGLSEVQRAFFEVLVMSRCHSIVGAKSAYRLLANLIGRTAFVNVATERRPQELIDAFWKALPPVQLNRELRKDVSEMVRKALNRLGLSPG